jgi:hypothetical protein
MNAPRPAPVLMLALAAALLGPAAPSKAQQGDPQNRLEPRSAPGEGQAFLARFAGEWDVAKAFYPQAGEPARVAGECRQALIHEGRFLESRFVFRPEGQPETTGTGLIGFEAETGLFTSVWIDSRSTRMSLRQAREPFDGERIVLFSRSLEPDGREARRSRTETRIEDGDRTIVHRQYGLLPDGGERLVMELRMTRKGGADAGSK